MTDLAIDAAVLNTFTIDDIETLEEICGYSIDELFGANVTAVPKGKLMKALGFIVKRRESPDITLEQVGQLSMAELATLIEGVVQVPPSTAAG